MAACNRDISRIAEAATVNVQEQIVQQVQASNANKSFETAAVLRAEEAPVIVRHEAPIMHQTHATHYRDSQVHVHGEGAAGDVKGDVAAQLKNKRNEAPAIVRADEAPVVVQHEAPVMHETHATHYKNTTVCHDGVHDVSQNTAVRR